MTIKSKVIVHDNDPDALKPIKSFLELNNLIGLRTHSWEVVKTLNDNVDLGAILLSDADDSGGVSGIDIVKGVHAIRNELPIFLRLTGKSSQSSIDEIKDMIAGTYEISNMDALKELIDKYLFSLYYPEKLVSGIQSITSEVLSSTFKSSKIISETPIVVRDSFIYGELFSLISLESDWCRGYMMLQTDEQSVIQAIRSGSTSLDKTDTNFRNVNSILAEVTNMAWGAIKSSFMLSSSTKCDQVKAQVPIIINHARQYVSFGSTTPQLVLRYEVVGMKKQIVPISIMQKLIFNLNWSPENFNEEKKLVDNCIASGEIELL